MNGNQKVVVGFFPFTSFPEMFLFFSWLASWDESLLRSKERDVSWLNTRFYFPIQYWVRQVRRKLLTVTQRSRPTIPLVTTKFCVAGCPSDERLTAEVRTSCGKDASYSVLRAAARSTSAGGRGCSQGCYRDLRQESPRDGRLRRSTRCSNKGLLRDNKVVWNM